MKYIIIVILIVGGCIYETGHSLQKNELERAGIDRGTRCATGQIQSKYTVLPKKIKREGFIKPNSSGPESERSKKQLASGRNLRISSRDSSNVKYTTFLVTAYTAHDKGMNGRGITASGVKARHMVTVAASRGYKFNQRIYLPSLGRIVVVHDRGGAIRGNKLDLYIDGPNAKEIAKKFGKRKLKGVVLK